MRGLVFNGASPFNGPPGGGDFPDDDNVSHQSLLSLKQNELIPVMFPHSDGIDDEGLIPYQTYCQGMLIGEGISGNGEITRRIRYTAMARPGDYRSINYRIAALVYQPAPEYFRQIIFVGRRLLICDKTYGHGLVFPGAVILADGRAGWFALGRSL